MNFCCLCMNSFHSVMTLAAHLLHIFCKIVYNCSGPCKQLYIQTLQLPDELRLEDYMLRRLSARLVALLI